MRTASFLALVLLGSTLAAAQTAGSTGTVSGHVTCGDTQRPARFASVILFGVPKDAKPQPKPDPNDVQAMMSQARALMSNMNMVQTQTDIAGDFSTSSVTPGDYYVFAAMPGYVQPLNTVQAIYESGADMSKPLPGVPMIHVSGAGSVSTQVTIDRSASVEGKLLWDDGSAVPGATITLNSVKSDKDKPIPSQFAMLAVGTAMSGGMITKTDDLGHFRISGLASGDYYLTASVQTRSDLSFGKGLDVSRMMSNSPLVVYAPAAFHKSAAKTVTLHAGETTGDQLITLNLNATHSVSGHVNSAEDHHPLNAGSAKLTDISDKTFTRSASVDANGTFNITFVPSGTYTLEISEGEDTEPSKKTGLFATPHTLRSYDDKSSTVIVADADLPGQNFELQPSKTTKKELDMNDVFKGLTGSDAKSSK